jgi:hypothetical protein
MPRRLLRDRIGPLGFLRDDVHDKFAHDVTVGLGTCVQESSALVDAGRSSRNVKIQFRDFAIYREYPEDFLGTHRNSIAQPFDSPDASSRRMPGVRRFHVALAVC